MDYSCLPQGELIHSIQYSLDHDLSIVIVNKACTFSLSPVVFCVSRKISDMFYTGVKLVL